MIVHLRKYLFIGPKENLSDFLIRSQEEGFIEFIFSRRKGAHFPPEVQKIIDAIKILRKQPIKTPYRKGGSLAYADEVADQIIRLNHAVEKEQEEKRLLEIEIARIVPFGPFSFKILASLKNRAK